MLSTPNANPGNRSNAITARSVQGEVRSFLILRSPSASRPYARSPVVTRKLCGSLTAARPRGKGGDTPATPRHPRRARSARAGIGRARARPRVEPSPNDGCLRARYPRRSPPGSFPGRHGLRFSLVARKVEAQSPRPELGADGGEDLSRIVARAVVDEEDARPWVGKKGQEPFRPQAPPLVEAGNDDHQFDHLVLGHEDATRRRNPLRGPPGARTAHRGSRECKKALRPQGLWY